MNLASALIDRGQWQLLGLCNRSLSSAQCAAAALQSGQAVASIHQLPHASVTFITTPDDELVTVAQMLADNPWIKPGDKVIHCSGVYPSSLLQPLKARGCSIASMHPFKAFPSGGFHPDAFQSMDCIVEGDEDAVHLLSTSFGQLGAKVVSLSTEKKALYHAAATMASNYMVTLASTATTLLVEAGIESSLAKQMCERIMDNNLRHLKSSATAEEALTGPLMRGDVGTILLHLSAITSPSIQGLYRAAGLATLPLTQHSDAQLITLTSLLHHTSIGAT